MTHLAKEFRNILAFLAVNRNETIILSSAVLLLTFASYHPVWNYWFSSFFYYAIIPVVVLLLLKKNPLDFGLGLGKIRIWGPYVIVICLLCVPILIAASYLGDFRSYYTKENYNFLGYCLEIAVYLIGWEYIFRGFLLFGLKEKLKEASILVQMIPFVLLHFGKPELETISTILTGILFGYVAYRGGSFWPAFLIHLFINVFFLAIVNLN
ncbi:MAG: CPBP family intramembrane glutamic endopeptidase [Dehalogenimonas sp.]|uniref:CPBP family intramembrane glutamic endopeptidase n=1 Tax=Candidatus Dehalogenimonas loeffleri TaxID=3127115 RepID=A0ABZ2J4L6_9CHLR|nr:CPBP family intramembrane glutamic endopeptidase [Dehalogenimonas sp.]